MNLQLKDKVIAVTGGTGSLGMDVVRLLLEEGAYCIIPRRKTGEENSFPYADHDQVAIIEGIDLTDESQAERFYEELVNEYGSLWGAVNAAGGFGMGKLLKTPFEEFSHQVRINLYTCYNSCRAAVRAIQDNGFGGRIVNVASRPALEPRQGSGLSAYTSSKAAVAALTEALAAELVEENILINAVAPSIIDTEPNRKAMPNADHSQWVSPEAIGSQILYLISPVNRATRGAVIPVYGAS